jgi:hypothetical protein
VARTSVLLVSSVGLAFAAAGALSSCSKKGTPAVEDGTPPDSNASSVLEASVGVSVPFTSEEIRERMLEASLLGNCDERIFERGLFEDRGIFRHHILFVRDKASPPGHIRLVGLHAGDWLSDLGFRNEDEIVWVNGFTLAQPSKAYEAYVRLRTADHLEVRIARDGKPMDLGYEVTGVESEAGYALDALTGDDWSRYVPVHDAPHGGRDAGH